MLSTKEALEALTHPFAHEDVGHLFVSQIPSPDEIQSAHWGLGVGERLEGEKESGNKKGSLIRNGLEDPVQAFVSALTELPSVTCGVLLADSEQNKVSGGHSKNPKNTTSQANNIEVDIANAFDIVLAENPTENPRTQTNSLPINHLESLNIESDIKQLENATSRNPIASLALVQLIRLGEKLDLQDQLIAESLTYSTLQSGPEFQAWLKHNSPEGKSSPKGKSAMATKSPNSQSEPVVLVERIQDQMILTLNRPEKHNAYSKEVRDALTIALRTADTDNSITKIELKASGVSFCSGGDLDEFGSTPDPATAHQVRSIRNVGWWLNRLKDRVEVYVHGACIGAGVELPAFTKNVTATEDAYFQLPEIKMGLVPGAGGTASITRRIGKQKMNWLALTCESIDAKRALNWGLIDAITPQS